MAQQTPIILQNKTTLDKILNVAIVASLVGGGYIFYKKYKGDKDKKEEEGRFGSSLETQQAMQLRNALNPSGIDFLKTIDSADQLKVSEIAHNIKDWDKVATAYKNLYKSSLVNDLRAELSPDGFEEVSTIIRNQREFVNATSSGTTPTNKYLYTVSQEVNIKLGIPGYTQPEAKSANVSKINFKNMGQIERRFVRAITQNGKIVNYERWYLLKVPGYAPTEFSWESIKNSFQYHHLWFPESHLSVKK